MIRPDEFYIRRQTNAGPNQGKWRVHHPSGWSVAVAESKTQGLALAAALTLALKDPEHGEDVGRDVPSIIGAECAWYFDGRVYPKWQRPGRQKDKAE